MKNNLLLSLPAVLALDLALPFLLAAPYRGYSHLTQAMSVLGNKKSPCHAIYNIWLAACGAAVALNSLMLRPLLAVYSKTAAAILAVILCLYAVGGCVLPAFFPVEEKKDLAGLSSRIHGYSSAAGFMLLAAAPPLAGFLAYRAGFSMLALFSWLCFFLAIVFFTAFIMADKPSFRHTPIAWEGLWQRLTLLCMYLPVACLVFAVL
ncbi:MAG: DUF998 domain-containing protein [Ruthenibacterium sp.]